MILKLTPMITAKNNRIPIVTPTMQPFSMAQGNTPALVVEV
jgi:hypothetical protein